MKSILLAEDNQSVARALGTRLHLAGYGVTNARDPAAALRAAKVNRPDLVITDINLPTMSGLTFMRRLKGLGLEDVPCLVITASYREGLWESAMDLGAAAYFEKPYDPAHLLASVTNILSQTENQNTQRTIP